MNQTLASPITIVLNMHREGALLSATLASLDAAVAGVQAYGVTVQLIAVLDNADDATRRVIESFPLERYDSCKLIEVSNGSLGMSRNDGISQADGEYIFLADADDLISTNYFSATLVEAARSSEKTIFFPELLFAFGDNYHITHYSDLDRVGILAFFSHHPYLSRVCAHRDLFEKIRFSDARLSQGHAYEDWHFNCEAIAAGYDIKVVSSIVLFYRQRAESLLRSAHALSSRQIAPSALFSPARFLALNTAWEARQPSLPKPKVRRVSATRRAILRRVDIRSEIECAGQIDHAISVRSFSEAPLYFNHQNSVSAGRAYLDAARIIGDEVYQDVFFFPFLSKGGAEKFVIQIIEAIARLDPTLRILLICGENYQGVSAEGDLPPVVTVLNLPLIDASLSMEERCLIALKVVERSSPGARLHFLSSVFTTTLIECYSKLFDAYRCFFYRFNNVEKIEDGKLVVSYSPLDFIKKHIDFFDGIVCDSKVMLARDIEQVPRHAQKWHILRAHVPLRMTQRRCLADRSRMRVLWASRFDEQKRPELLPLIAAELRKRSLDVCIDAFGYSVFRSTTPERVLHAPELTYRGPFQTFFDLPLEDYDVFLYTSWNDGVPNVILEAGAAGLPVIAPDVGGISDVIRNGETGLLLPSSASEAEMAKAYVDALEKLMTNSVFGQRLAAGLSALLHNENSQDEHEKSVQKIFGVDRVNLDSGQLTQLFEARGRRLRRMYVHEKALLATRRGARSNWSEVSDYSRARALIAQINRLSEGSSPSAKFLGAIKNILRPIWRRIQ